MLLMLLLANMLSAAYSDEFSVKRIGNLIPFNDNAFAVNSPEKGMLLIRVHDDISVYREISQAVSAGETTIHWDGCAFNHEKLAQKNYTITAVLTGESGEEYSVSFNTPVEYTGQCLQYVLPSSDHVSLKSADDWFVEFRTVQKGTVTFIFQNGGSGSDEEVFSVNTTGGRINRLTYTELTRKKMPAAGFYHVTVYENTKQDESYHFDITVVEEATEKQEVFLTGEILPEDGMTEDEIWQMMQQPSVVVDIDPFKHQNVYTSKDRNSASLGTLHGQTQALKVMKIEDNWAFVGAWNHEEAEYVEGWVPYSVLKVSVPSPEYGILINKQKQTMDVYCRGRIIDTLEVSTGRPEERHPEQETSAGSFLTGLHRVDFSTNGKKYDYVIQYDGGNLLHQIPYEWGKDKKDFSLGRAYLGAKASHACIRIQSEPGANGINAYWLWTHIPYHTRVMIIDDPEERRPVLDKPAETAEMIETESGQVRITFVDSGQNEISPESFTEEKDGHRIGTAVCTEKEYIRNPGAVSERIAELRQQDCEIIILKCFWNEQNLDRHTAVQEAMARKAIKSGADLVIGYGNRSCLGCERSGNGMILYGLGNANAKKSGRKKSFVSLKADVIFDFSDELKCPIVILSAGDEETDAGQAIRRFTEDSIGSGIGQVYFLNQ